MKRADPRVTRARVDALEQHANAFAHLAGGFIRKRDGENRAARSALLDQVRNAMCDDTRFACARTCQNEYRPIGGEHSFALLWIEVFENIHFQGSGPGGECILAERSKGSKRPA